MDHPEAMSDHPEEEKKKKHEAEEATAATAEEHSADYAPYPKLETIDLGFPPPQPPPPASSTPATQSETHQQPSDTPPTPGGGSSHKSVSWSSDLTREVPSAATTMPPESNPYVAPATSPPASSSKLTMDKVRNVLGRWGKKVGETAKKTEDLAGNVWQHLKTGPSVADAAMGRIAHGTKVLAEGGYEKIFKQTFETLPDEQFKKSFACYLSTSAGPVMGVLYVSTVKLAFCSDSPLSYKVGDKTEWSYYKVLIPLHQLRTVNPSASKVKPAEKYIQIVSVDNHEFWFMGFVNYDNAVKNLQEALLTENLQPLPQ